MNRDDAIETLAGIHHQIWVDWQKIVHSKCQTVPEGVEVRIRDHGTTVVTLNPGDMVIPAECYEQWQRQVLMPYTQLADYEKQRHRNTVKLLWPVFVQYVAEWLQRVHLTPAAEEWQKEMRR